ncbi:MAG: Gfo/Idh/MocA family oxidoreductase [Chloroflexota bacterium]|nr:Gfo/Idh/MocA family oxidoreductase [Chloroflexota bacterium]
MGATRSVGIGLIGIGFMGGIHARAYRNVPWIFPDAAAQPDIRVVADARLDEARAFAERFAIPKWTDDWRTLLDRSDVEVVDICTPPALHGRMATAAAEAGKHVYCEKPVGRGLDETTAIWEAVQRAGVLSFVGLNYRLAPAVILAHDLIRAGRIGEIRQVKVSFRTAYDAGGQNIAGWRYSREQAGAGTLADHGSHVFDLAMHLAGPIARLCGTTGVVVAERPDPEARGATFVVDNDDTFAALVEFASGATGIIDASRIATGSRGELTFDIVGTAGAVRWDLRRMNELRLHVADAPDTNQGWTTIQTGPANRPYGRFIPSSLGLGYVDTKVIEAYRIVEAVATGEAMSPNIGDMVRVARCIEAVQQGGWVEIVQ